jgi:hypothetical protein
MIINEINMNLIANLFIYLQTEIESPLKTLENEQYRPI